MSQIIQRLKSRISWAFGDERWCISSLKEVDDFKQSILSRVKPGSKRFYLRSNILSSEPIIGRVENSKVLLKARPTLLRLLTWGGGYYFYGNIEKAERGSQLVGIYKMISPYRASLLAFIVLLLVSVVMQTILISVDIFSCSYIGDECPTWFDFFALFGWFMAIAFVILFFARVTKHADSKARQELLDFIQNCAD